MRSLELITAEYDKLMDQLGPNWVQIEAARHYLSGSGSNSYLVSSRLERCLTRRAEIVALLRANQMEAIKQLYSVIPDSRL